MSTVVKLIWAFLAVAIASITEPTTSKLEPYIEEVKTTEKRVDGKKAGKTVDVAVQTGDGVVQKPWRTQEIIDVVLASEEFAGKLEGMVKKISAKKLEELEKEVRTLRNQLEINAYDLKSFKRQLNKLERIENDTVESVKKHDGMKTNLNLEAALVQSNALNKNLLLEFDGLKQKMGRIENDTRVFNQTISKETTEMAISQKTIEKIARKVVEFMAQKPENTIERPKKKPQRKPRHKPHVDKFPSFFDVVKALPRSNFEPIENCQTFTNIANFTTPKFIQTTICNNLIDSNALEQIQNDTTCDIIMENIYSYTIVLKICDLNQTSGNNRGLPFMRMNHLREEPIKGNWLSNLVRLGKHRKRSYFNRLIKGISRNSSERVIVNKRSTTNSSSFDRSQINKYTEESNNGQSTEDLFGKLVLKPFLRTFGKFIRPIRRPTIRPMNHRPIIQPIINIIKPLIQSAGPYNGKYQNSKPKPAPRPIRRPTPRPTIKTTPRPALRPRPRPTPKPRPKPTPLYYDLDEQYPQTGTLNYNLHYYDYDTPNYDSPNYEAPDYETPNYEEPNDNSKRKRIIAKLIGQVVINLFERVSEYENLHPHNPNMQPRSVGEQNKTQSNVTAGSIIETLVRLGSNKTFHLPGNLTRNNFREEPEYNRSRTKNERSLFSLKGLYKGAKNSLNYLNSKLKNHYESFVKKLYNTLQSMVEKTNPGGSRGNDKIPNYFGSPANSYPSSFPKPHPSSPLAPYSGSHPQSYPSSPLAPYPGSHPQPYPSSPLAPYPGSHPQPHPSSSLKPYPSTSLGPYPGSHPSSNQKPYPGLQQNNFPSIQHRTKTVHDSLDDAGLIRYIKFPVDEQRLDVLRKLIEGSLRLRESALSKN